MLHEKCLTTTRATATGGRDLQGRDHGWHLQVNLSTLKELQAALVSIPSSFFAARLSGLLHRRDEGGFEHSRRQGAGGCDCDC